MSSTTNKLNSAILLILIFLISGCIGTEVSIPQFDVMIEESAHSYPIGNVSRTDISSIPVLVEAIDEVLVKNTSNQITFTITQAEYEQIDQLFDELELPPRKSGFNSWYVYFEETLLNLLPYFSQPDLCACHIVLSVLLTYL